jgi:primosomal protein N' (replication factor Y) (superfamily II helicase)
LEGVELVGPAPCAIDRIRGRWRWHFIIRSPSAKTLGMVAKYFFLRFRLPAGKADLRLILDRDPVQLL